MALDKDLADTLKAVYGLEAARRDNLEDYFHDAIIQKLVKSQPLDSWLPYIYQCVYRRIGRGREGPMDLPLEESIVPETRPDNLDIKIDVRNAFKLLTARQAAYIYAYFYEGYTLPEIAKEYKTSMQCVDKCITRGLHKMKGAL